MRNEFKIGLLVAGLLPPQMVVLAGPMKESRPNIILVMTDDQGMGDLPCLGNPIVGRWEAKHPQARDVPSTQFGNCAVRTEPWRFVNNSELDDISVDPGETTDVSAGYPEVIEGLRTSYDAWWAETVALMVNEGVTTQRMEKNPPLAVRYKKQLAAEGIPDGVPSEYRQSMDKVDQ